MKTIRFLAVLITIYLVFASGSASQIRAQATNVFTTGLTAPTKIITAGQSSLLVAEAGTMTPNQGRISLVNRASGARQTLIDGLPSGINRAEGQPAPSGPSGIKLSGLKLYVSIGQGDAVLPGGRGGLQVNPNPATPLNDSILELTLPADYEALTSGFSLSFGDQASLANGGAVTLLNAQGKTLVVRMVANLPDWKREPAPNLPQYNVRASNVFGVELTGGNLYAVDASFNQLYKINPETGVYETFASFAPKPNPLPFGPPFSEAVPNNVRVYGSRLLVSQLVGFPFAPGVSEVREVNPADGSQRSFVGGLTSAMDILPVAVPGDYDLFYVLEFSANMLGSPTPPGRLKLYRFLNSQGAGDPVVLASNLISPTSLARDGESGDLFVTEIFTGRIVRVAATENSGIQFLNNNQDVCSPCSFPLGNQN
ncbi:MAG TPA: ScyD/ScyE family protein [Pyrinomonadaceae bacterium]|nr:ScyD/ScyE family protein [Pyrinomonadaceae bacterium]